VPACNLVRLARRRHLTDLVAGHRRGLHFDAVVADRAIRFYQFLRHSKGEWGGQKFKLAPWQKFIGLVYGWMRADATRPSRSLRIRNNSPLSLRIRRTR
jgi:phage terminase large subunit-like protein